jgi:hypothetical protein
MGLEVRAQQQQQVEAWVGELEEAGQHAQEGPAQRVIEAGGDELLERVDDEEDGAPGVAGEKGAEEVGGGAGP